MIESGGGSRKVAALRAAQLQTPNAKLETPKEGRQPRASPLAFGVWRLKFGVEPRAAHRPKHQKRPNRADCFCTTFRHTRNRNRSGKAGVRQFEKRPVRSRGGKVAWALAQTPTDFGLKPKLLSPASAARSIVRKGRCFGFFKSDPPPEKLLRSRIARAFFRPLVTAG